MMKPTSLNPTFPTDFTKEEKARAQTLFFNCLSVEGHRFYRGKIMVTSSVPVENLDLYNIWYTPGVSAVSTTIRDDNAQSFILGGRGNKVAIVSDSTRVLGDGDCTPSGGLGVMEGKAIIMNQLGGIDAFPLCVDSRNEQGENDPQKIIDFVKMLAPSVGAINLEDISQPNCFKILDVLQKECDIPVWHDDAQGTACVTLAGLINALKLAGKSLSQVKIVLLGAGASNTTIARLCITDGADPTKMIIIDSKGGLHTDRNDIKIDERFYRKWELCQQTNPNKINNLDQALEDADVLIALSKPGPNTFNSQLIGKMANKSIVFICANPTPEIYPHQAKEAGAFIVATGRGDYPNQINNSLCFPGLLQGVLMVQAKKITDTMAITAARALAEFSAKKRLDPEHIITDMSDIKVYAHIAASVAKQAIDENLADIKMSWRAARRKASARIEYARKTVEVLRTSGVIEDLPEVKIRKALKDTIAQIMSERQSD